MTWLHPILTLPRRGSRAAYFHRYNKGRRSYIARKARERRLRRHA